MQIKVTLQPEIYKKLKENSKENMRTLSAEVNFMLKKAYDATDVVDATVVENNEEQSSDFNSNKKIKREGDLW